MRHRQIRHSGFLDGVPHIEVLEEEAAASVRNAEGVDPAEQQAMWCCNHCTEHINNLQPYSAVVKHVQET